jgi:hypothetical protein
MFGFNKLSGGTQFFLIATAVCYYGYWSYMSTTVSVCDNLKGAFGIGADSQGFEIDSNEFGFIHDDSAMRFVQRSPKLEKAVRTCISDGHAPYFPGGSD